VIKLINVKDFEELLNCIEKEVELVENLKKDLSLNTIFYLDKFDRFDLKESILLLENLENFFKKEKMEIEE
jgi:hypothetical protein